MEDEIDEVWSGTGRAKERENKKKFKRDDKREKRKGDNRRENSFTF